MALIDNLIHRIRKFQIKANYFLQILNLQKLHLNNFKADFISLENIENHTFVLSSSVNLSFANQQKLIKAMPVYLKK